MCHVWCGACWLYGVLIADMLACVSVLLLVCMLAISWTFDYSTYSFRSYCIVKVGVHECVCVHVCKTDNCCYL
jgi:hypothetical protein